MQIPCIKSLFLGCLVGKITRTRLPKVVVTRDLKGPATAVKEKEVKEAEIRDILYKDLFKFKILHLELALHKVIGIDLRNIVKKRELNYV